MHDDLPKFPTPKEAFGRPAQQQHAVPAYSNAAGLPKPPQQRYRQASDGNGYRSPSMPELANAKAQQGQRSASSNYPASHSQPNLPYQQQQARIPISSQYQQEMPRQPVQPPAQPPMQQQTYQRYQNQPSRQTQPVQQPQPPVKQMQQPPMQPVQPVQQPQPPMQPHRSSQAHSKPPSQASSRPEPTEKVDLRSLFDDVDRYKRGYLTERELSKALVNGDYSLFDTHTVRLMMKMFDRDGDGAIYFAEFGQLWKYLHDWRLVFDRFDTSNSDTISYEEFNRALTAFGYTLSTPCVQFMFDAGSKLNRQGQRIMAFDMFVQSCISIKSITDTFKRYDTDRDGYVTMGFEDFLMEATKLH